MFDALPVGRDETDSQTDRDINERLLCFIYQTMRGLFVFFVLYIKQRDIPCITIWIYIRSCPPVRSYVYGASHECTHTDCWSNVRTGMPLCTCVHAFVIVRACLPAHCSLAINRLITSMNKKKHHCSLASDILKC